MNALIWFRGACEAFHAASYRYVATRYSKPHYWFGLEEAGTVAEHYGIATQLMNWSWDPLVAVVFALNRLYEGDSARVIIHEIDPRGHSQLMLAPPIAQRIWRQRGFFQELACPGPTWSIPTVSAMLIRSPQIDRVSAFPRIVFPRVTGRRRLGGRGIRALTP